MKYMSHENLEMPGNDLIQAPSHEVLRINDPMDDTAGAPFIPPIPRNQHEGQSGETTFLKNKAQADEVKEALKEKVIVQDNRIPGPGLESPQALTLQRDALNMQLRDLRIKLKNADTFFAQWTKAGRDTLTSVQKAIDETRDQRDALDAQMEEMLPAQAKSVARADVVSEARQKIGDVLAPALAGQRDRKADIPRKDALSAERTNLSNELSTLKFWQFGRKQEVTAAIKEIDREMSGILNKEKGL